MGQLLTYSRLAALIAGGNWNNGAHCGARAVNCNNYPWNVNTNIGGRGACDLVRALQAQSIYGTLARIKGKSTECLITYSQSGCPAVRQREKYKLLVSSCGERQELIL